MLFTILNMPITCQYKQHLPHAFERVIMEMQII